jgi:hypothetical protein
MILVHPECTIDNNYRSFLSRETWINLLLLILKTKIEIEIIKIADDS